MSGPGLTAPPGAGNCSTGSLTTLRSMAWWTSHCGGPHGQLLLALSLTIEGDQITGYELIGDPARLHHLDLAVLAA